MASTTDRGFWTQAKTSMARAPIPNAMLAILMLFLTVVLIRIVFTDTSIPTVSTDVEAAARPNERMLQMVQWSLDAILGLGLALIGINWFTTTQIVPRLLICIKDWKQLLRVTGPEFQP